MTREDVVVLAQRRHDLRREGLVAQLAQLVARDRATGPRSARWSRPSTAVDVVLVEAQHGAQEGHDAVGRVARDLEAHGVAALAPPQLLLDRLEQIVGLFLVDLEVQVARDAEDVAARDADAGEEDRPRAGR